MDKYITIYKIYLDDKSYIGSTGDKKITNRIRMHKYYADNGRDTKLYNFMRSNKDFNFKILERKNVNPEQRQILEQKWIELEKPNLNNINSYLSKEDLQKYQKEYYKKYYINNKDRLKNNMSIWSKNNRLRVNNRVKKWNRDNTIICECGGRYNTKSKWSRDRHFRSILHAEFQLI